MALNKKDNTPEVKEYPRDKIEMVPIEKLIPYARNPRNNDETVPILMRSIKDYGFNVPLIIDEDNFIVCGHARWRAAKSLSLRELPCIRVMDLSADQIKAFRLADNKVSEAAKWNQKLLKIEFDKIKDFSIKPLEFKSFGFDEPKDDKYSVGDDKGALKNDFIVSPFSVINGASPDCLALDVKWSAMLKPRKVDYPPHLVEILFRWFAPSEGTILDPFFQSSTKKCISERLGFTYKEKANIADEVDMVYLDLLSRVHPDMTLEPYVKDIKEAVSHLSSDRFVVAHVQERRDGMLGYRSQLSCELQQLMREMGYIYHNELCYITKGLDQIDDDHGKFLRTRIVPERHRSILVFFKGKVRNIRNDFDPVIPEYIGGDV